MVETPINVILDGDMIAYSEKTNLENNPSIDPTHVLPPVPVWSCMVDGTLNFCHLVWDLYQDSKISVTVAGKTPVSLVEWEQPNRFEKLCHGFQCYRPTESNHTDHILGTFRKSFGVLLATRSDPAMKMKSGRIVFVTTSKGPDEVGYMYRAQREGILKDLRAMLYTTFPIHRMNNCVANIHIDILRIMPTSVPTQIPADIVKEQIAPGVTFSIYNIPNTKHDLPNAMIHLAQLHFNIDCLQIREESTSIKNSECYITTPRKKERPHPSVRIYDPLFATNMTQQGILLKKEYHTIPVTNIDWCTPHHMCTFLKQTMDDYTHNLQIEIMNGAHIYIFSNPSVKLESAIDNSIQSKLWNRILLSYKGKLVLQDHDHELNNSLVAHDTVAVKHEVKQEFHHQLLSITSLTRTTKSKEFIDKLVRPNTYQDVEDFMKQANATNNQTSLTANYNTRLYGPSRAETKFSKCTMAMERQTKFQTCLRDGQAYSSLDFDLQHLDLFRAPTAPAFGILPQGLISGMFEELEEALVSDNHTKDVLSMKNLIDMMVMELFNAKRNKPSQRLFPKKAGQEQIKLLATKSLVSLFLLGKRFNNDSPKHYEICQRILNDITVQNERDLKPLLDEANEAVNSNNKRQVGIDAAWDQAKRYKTMTHREREDVIMHDIPPPTPPPMQQKQGSVNPLFRGRRHAPDIGTIPSRTYPDPSIAIPYLQIPAPETVLDDVNPGPPNSLLAQFWSAHQQRMKTIKDFDGRKIRYQTGE